jgi:hypothetical protein
MERKSGLTVKTGISQFRQSRLQQGNYGQRPGKVIKLRDSKRLN